MPAKAKLYVILGSHACRTGILMMEHKGIEYQRVELPTGLHSLALRLIGFPGNPAPFRDTGDGRRLRMLGIADRLGTVPSLRFDGQYIKTSRGIARFLDRIQPDPPLFPPDAEKRRAVEEAEKWADEIFQMAARRLLLVARVRGRDGLVNRGDDGRLGPLLFRSQRLRLLATQSIARFLAVNPDSAEEIDGALPGMLDRIDGWIETGLLHGEQLNAADFMIAPSLALITYRPDLRPELERRPLIGLVDRLLPEPVASRPRSRAGTIGLDLQEQPTIDSAPLRAKRRRELRQRR